ncbi:hydroxyisourate hydrolase [Fulvimarina sp. 2208YS6-2-32]|uniref:5-hydroxyisourate hydrolase n=1 Tax=Fulvimarina uroteuthidis TaxID=3098149 RepID=A0ABU5HY01_9HYPH|nr:hydroxyisourate hydrolase [Fulvimarina sp. 2208YS6-2-32]MDY8108017.1 hydroxyisourate hydrolase [Fulvimarina sp. 2208YS6-2-32]
MANQDGGFLTTHVLDTATGRPAGGLRIVLHRLSADGSRETLADVETNQDGRCDAPILGGDDFQAGRYELVFGAGRYFDRMGLDLPDPKFLDEVVIRFGMDEPTHYHVPLLISPFGYSTYRGS